MAAPRRQAAIAASDFDPADIVMRITEFYLDATQTLPQSKVTDTIGRWFSKFGEVDVHHEAPMIAQAMLFAIDLELFTPSLSGKTSFDRLAARNSGAALDKAAMDITRRAVPLLFEVTSVETDVSFTAKNLATNEVMRIHDDGARPEMVGATALARVSSLSADLFCTIGPITPLDQACLANARGWLRPGKSAASLNRGVAAVYRDVIRLGNPMVPGFNNLPDFANDDHIDENGVPVSEFDLIARNWAALPDGQEPERGVIERIRSLVSPNSVVEVVFKAYVTQLREVRTHAPIYRKMAELLMETLDRRARAGSGDPTPFDSVAAIIAQEMVHAGYPAGARDLFIELRRTFSTPQKSTGENDELSRVIERIRALRAKTIDQGCTEQEAIAAAGKVAELLDRYGLSLSEIDIRQQTCEGVGISSTRKRTGPIDSCFQSIARFCDCKAWHETAIDGTVRSVFFGLPADVAAAHYLYERGSMAFDTETKAFQAGVVYQEAESRDRRRVTASFQIGLANGIIRKLDELKRQRDTMTSSGSGRDLVPVKASVVEDDFAKLGMAFVTKEKKRSSLVQQDAYEAGIVAGQQFKTEEQLK